MPWPKLKMMEFRLTFIFQQTMQSAQSNLPRLLVAISRSPAQSQYHRQMPERNSQRVILYGTRAVKTYQSYFRENFPSLLQLQWALTEYLMISKIATIGKTTESSSSSSRTSFRQLTSAQFSLQQISS